MKQTSRDAGQKLRKIIQGGGIGGTTYSKGGSPRLKKELWKLIFYESGQERVFKKAVLTAQDPSKNTPLSRVGIAGGEGKENSNNPCIKKVPHAS